MSLFTFIKYPVYDITYDFNHIPDDIWDAYWELRKKFTIEDLQQEKKDLAVLRKLILEWPE